MKTCSRRTSLLDTSQVSHPYTKSFFLNGYNNIVHNSDVVSLAVGYLKYPFFHDSGTRVEYNRWHGHSRLDDHFAFWLNRLELRLRNTPQKRDQSDQTSRYRWPVLITSKGNDHAPKPHLQNVQCSMSYRALSDISFNPHVVGVLIMPFRLKKKILAIIDLLHSPLTLAANVVLKVIRLN